MVKAVLISIQPKWCELIAAGKKTIEVRKTKPSIPTPFKCYIYCTKDFYRNGDGYFQGKYCGKVIGEFVCDEITSGFWIAPFTDYLQSQSCLSYDEVCDYANGKPIFAWHISDLVIYDKPKELSEFIVPSKIGCCNEGKCRGCKWLDRGNGFNIEDDCFAPFDTDEYKPLRRPPQSWCYVEEVQCPIT